MKRMSLFLLTVLMSCRPAAVPKSSPAHQPDGWMEVSKELAEKNWCSRYETYWKVSTNAQGIVISREHGYPPDAWEQLPAIPEVITRSLIRSSFLYEDVAGKKITLHGLPFANGWLTGYDQGEFGGAIFWVDIEGKSPRQLYGSNPINLIPVRNGVLILMGLRHLESVGYAAFLWPEDLGRKGTIPPAINLGETPIAALQLRDERSLSSFLILTDDGIRELMSMRIGKSSYQSFHISTLQPRLSQLNANSIAQSTTDGRLFIGLSDHVLVMDSIASMGPFPIQPPAEHWYSRTECLQIQASDNGCKCIPALDFERKEIKPLP